MSRFLVFLRLPVVLPALLGSWTQVGHAESLGPGVQRPAAASVAAPSDDTAEREEAKARYQKGVRAYAAGRYPEAIELFREANRREPSAALSYNMGRAYQKLRDDAGALRSYRDYLRRAPGAADEGAVRQLVRTLAKRLSERGVQQVTVMSTPPGATVFLDSEAVGVTPWTGETAPGGHALSLQLEGHKNVEKRFELAPTEPVDVEATLEEEPAGPPIATSPALPAASPRLPEPEPEPEALRAAPGTSATKVLGIVALSAGGAALGGALVFELLRRDSESKAGSETQQIRLADDLDTMNSRRTAARVLGGVGAGVAALGGVLLLVSPSPRPEQDRQARVRFDVTQTGVTGTLSGKF